MAVYPWYIPTYQELPTYLVFFSQIKIEGPEALKALEWLCTAPMDNPIGSCTYSLMLNEAGGIEADITVTRISEDAFYLITGAAFTHYVHERVITSFQSLHTLKPRYNEP